MALISIRNLLSRCLGVEEFGDNRELFCRRIAVHSMDEF